MSTIPITPKTNDFDMTMNTLPVLKSIMTRVGNSNYDLSARGGTVD